MAEEARSTDRGSGRLRAAAACPGCCSTATAASPCSGCYSAAASAEDSVAAASGANSGSDLDFNGENREASRNEALLVGVAPVVF